MIFKISRIFGFFLAATLKNVFMYTKNEKKGEKKEKKRRLDTNILKCKTIWNVTFRAYHENKNNNKTKRVENLSIFIVIV